MADTEHSTHAHLTRALGPAVAQAIVSARRRDGEILVTVASFAWLVELLAMEDEVVQRFRAKGWQVERIRWAVVEPAP
jgi:hypothetical protein